jgi:quercetin dioxygenase-like cupin family protein
MTTRLVLTGHDGAGQAVFTGDADVEEVLLAPGLTGLTVLDSRESAAGPGATATDGPSPFLPGPDGIRFAKLTFFAPGEARSDGVVLADLAARMADGGGFGMHRTPTVDFIVVLSGEIVIELDDRAERRLVAGDTLVQNGTRHGWRNRTDQPATIALVMVGVASRD